MNVKLKVLTAGALFFLGGQAVMAQKKKDSVGEKKIDEVVIVGYGQKSTKKVTSSISTVKAEELVKISAPSADAILQGATTGLQVSSTSGAPGAGFNVRIRGVSSISSSNEPLYVVDGVPISNGSAGPNGYGGQTNTLLSQLNMNDVEDIQVLKDASAAAIYGSRGANGVVLITTKKGKKGQARFSLNSVVGFQNQTKNYEKMKAGEYYKYLDLARFNTTPSLGPYYHSQADGVWSPTSGQSIEDFYASDFGDNYLKGVTRENQPLYELSASVSGGTENTKYYLGFSNFDQQGTIINQDYNRQSFTINLDQKLNDMFTVVSQVRLSNEANGRVNGDNNIYAPLTTAILEYPGQNFYNSNGSYNSTPTGTWLFSNPLQNALEVKNRAKTFGVNTSLGLESKFSKNLMMSTRFNLERINYDETRFFPSTSYQGSGAKGQSDYYGRLYNTFTVYNTLTYNNKIGDFLDYTILGGFEYFNRRVNSTDVITQNIPFGSSTPAAGSVKNTAYYYPSLGNRTFSYFSRLSLGLFNNLFIDATLRADSSSKLTYDNRTEIFPSVSAAYVISDAKWFKVKPISLFKIRAGWGELGNQSGLGNFETSSVASATQYGVVPSLNVGAIAAGALVWERTAQSDLGAELGFFNNRLKISYDYYNKESKNLFLSRTISGTNGSAVGDGSSSVRSNAAELYNRGHEIGINADIFKSSNFGWNSQFNITFNKNEVTKLIGEPGIPIDFGFATRVAVGQPVGAFFALRSLGIYQSNSDVPTNLFNQGIRAGDVIYDDINGDGVINSLDRTFVGSAQPDFYGNFRNTFRYKSFDLSTNLIFTIGQEVFNNSMAFAGVSGNPYYGKFADQTGYWTVDNPSNTLPRPVFGAAQTWNNQRSDRFIEDGSYIRLREIQLGYTLSKNILGITGNTSIRFYVAADNLFTWSDYSGPEPEVNVFGQANVATGTDFFTQPLNKTIKFGFNINF